MKTPYPTQKGRGLFDKGDQMNCEILISEKLGAIPLAECGGVVLQPGDKLVVSCAKAGELRRHYGSLLITVGYEVRDSLKQGSYEYLKKSNKQESAVVHAAKHEGEDAPAMVASDKSMQGKHKMRRKG